MHVIKTIKFDLPIDGVKVKNLEELCDHFSTEILDLHHSGLLLKWLKNQRKTELAEKVEQIDITSSDQERLNQLCLIFDIALEPEIIALLTKSDNQEFKVSINLEQLEKDDFHKKYQQFISDFEKFSRFNQYCKKLFESNNIQSGDVEFIKMIHFIETGEEVNLTKCRKLHRTGYYKISSNIDREVQSILKDRFIYKKSTILDENIADSDGYSDTEYQLIEYYLVPLTGE